jgi:hypothetical protein
MKLRNKQIIVWIAIILLTAFNGILNMNFEKDTSFNLKFFSSKAIADPENWYPSGLDGFCKPGCVAYVSDDGMTWFYGVEIICNTSGYHCYPFGGCTFGYC